MRITVKHFEILKVFKVFQKPDKCQKLKGYFFKDAQTWKYRLKGQLIIFDLLIHEESMGFHSRSYGTLLHFVFLAQNIF